MTIEHSDILDLRDLAELAREAVAILEDAESEADDREDAEELIHKFGSFLADLGYAKSDRDYEGIASELESIADNEPTLIAKDYFTEYCKELCKDIGDIPSELPWYIANHIDWEAVAGEIKQDYNTVELDGEEYLIRSF